MRRFHFVTFASVVTLSGCGLLIGTGDFTDQEPSSSSSSSSSTSTSSGATCEPGRWQDCGTLDPGLVSPCKVARQQCQPNGTWGDCVGGVDPKPTDDCVSDPKVDANCNGTIDCPCDPAAPPEPCYDGMPADTQNHLPCHAGTRACKADGTGWEKCINQVLPKTEDCTTPDDEDCDGNPLSGNCVCAPGSQKDCYTGNPNDLVNGGICKHGTQNCLPDGTGWDPTCNGEVLPMPAEDCATPFDDDCNGKTNDAAAGCTCTAGTTASCYTAGTGQGVGICHAGTWTCGNGTGWGPCMNQQTPLVEDCTTPEDDDCDGVPNQASAGCVCLPGTTAACYTGPANTRGKGICKDGTQGCSADGKSYQACVGDIKPAPKDDCSNNLDDDCSGTYCTQPLWVSSAKGTGGTYVSHLAVDQAGNSFVAGDFYGSFSLGASTLVAVDQNDAYLTKLDSSGGFLWSRQLGGLQDQWIRDVVTDSAGNVVVFGGFSGTVSFPGGNPITAQGTDAFVAKFDPSGTLLWSIVLNEGAGGGNHTEDAYGVSIDNNGDVLITGIFSTNVVIPPLAALSAGGWFVAKLNGTTGAGVWAQSAPGQAFAVRADSSGNVVVGGTYAATSKIGNTTLTSTGGNDVFLTRLTSAGQFVWAKSFGSSGGNNDYFGDLRLDSTGSIIITGSFVDNISFGGPMLSSPNSTSRNGYVAKFLASGAHIWSQQFGSSSAASAYQHSPHVIGIDGADRVFVGGDCQGKFDVVGTFDCGANGITPFLLGFSAAGSPYLNRRYDLTGGRFYGLASHSSSQLGLVAAVHTSIDLGGAPVAAINGLLVGTIATQ